MEEIRGNTNLIGDTRIEMVNDDGTSFVIPSTPHNTINIEPSDSNDQTTLSADESDFSQISNTSQRNGPRECEY